MKRVVLTLLVVLFASSAFAADPQKPTTLAAEDGTETSYCEASECGSLPADEMGVKVPDSYPGCVKGRNLETCKLWCECGWNYNKSKCKNGRACLDLAQTEHNVCLTQCEIDYA